MKEDRGIEEWESGKVEYVCVCGVNQRCMECDINKHIGT